MPDVSQPSATARQQAVDRLATPPGALGRLGDVGVWVASCQGAVPPRPLDNVRLVIFAGDHGVAAHGVSAFPPAITGAMVRTFLAGKAGVRALARAHAVAVRVLDLVVADDFSDVEPARRETLAAYKIRKGSGAIHLQNADRRRDRSGACSRCADRRSDGARRCRLVCRGPPLHRARTITRPRQARPGAAGGPPRRRYGDGGRPTRGRAARAAVVAVGVLGHWLDLPTLVMALLAVGAAVLGNRAFHLDGLSDTVDGYAASFDAQRSLAVMKTGTSGPAGVAATVLVVGQLVARRGPARSGRRVGRNSLVAWAVRAVLAHLARRGPPDAPWGGDR